MRAQVPFVDPPLGLRVLGLRDLTLLGPALDPAPAGSETQPLPTRLLPFVDPPSSPGPGLELGLRVVDPAPAESSITIRRSERPRLNSRILYQGTKPVLAAPLPKNPQIPTPQPYPKPTLNPKPPKSLNPKS